MLSLPNSHCRNFQPQIAFQPKQVLLSSPPPPPLCRLFQVSPDTQAQHSRAWLTTTPRPPPRVCLVERSPEFWGEEGFSPETLQETKETRGLPPIRSSAAAIPSPSVFVHVSSG